MRDPNFFPMPRSYRRRVRLTAAIIIGLALVWTASLLLVFFCGRL